MVTSLHAPPPPRDLPWLKHQICERVRDFEIASLLDLLASLGYRPGDIWFRGHLTEQPQPTLLHHIEFRDAGETIAGPSSARGRTVALGSVAELAADSSADRPGGLATAARPAPRPQPGAAPAPVTITVNLGLLSCRSPLPSYFQQLLRDDATQEPLVELLRVIDRNLLRARLTCDRPERIVARWEEVTKDLLRIQSLDSLVGLSWLFRHVFPELRVQVERTGEQLRVPYVSARLGASELGHASLGALTRIDVHDFQVTLTCEETLLRPQVPWLHEVRRRLTAIVFPALDPVCMNLTILLELRDQLAVAVLHDDRAAADDSYLGQAPLGRPAPGAAQVRKVVLHRGLLPRDQLDTDELEAALAAQAAVQVTALAGGRARTAPGDLKDERAAALVLGQHELDQERELELELELGRFTHRYRALVRWGVRRWFRQEPYAIELRCEHVIKAAPTPHQHPQLWALLRDRARQAMAAELADAILAYYGAATVTEAILADLLARDLEAALHALFVVGGPTQGSPAIWERFVRAQP